MTYQSVADVLSQCFSWFNNFIYLFVDFITDNPLISAGVLVVVGVPMMLLVLQIFCGFSFSSSSSSSDQRENSTFKPKKYDFKFKKMIRDSRPYNKK